MLGPHRAAFALLESLSGSEVLVILVMALVVLGPDRLPGVARQAGQWFNKLRDMTSSMQNEMREVLDDPTMQPLKELGEFAAQPRKKLAEYARAAMAEDPEPEPEPEPEGVGDTVSDQALTDQAVPAPAEPEATGSTVLGDPLEGVPEILRGSGDTTP